MAVHPASAWLFAVIDMDEMKAGNSDKPIEPLHRLFVGITGGYVISCGENMTGIETYPHPVVVVEGLHEGT
jgi:hypothetical protein